MSVRLQLPLQVALLLALAGCAAPGEMFIPAATSRDLDNDRVLVTVDAGPGRPVTTLSPSGRLDYQPSPPEQVRERHLQTARQLAERFSLELEEDWPIPALDVHCFVFRVSGSEHERARVLADLRAHPKIDSVQPLQFFEGELAGNVADPGDPLADWNSELHERLRRVHRKTTGDSVKLAVIDAGVDVDHEDLAGGRITTVDLVDGRRDPPAEVHGTAVVGVLAARPGNGVGIRGIAPGAEVLLLRACWAAQAGGDRTICNSFTLARALSLALEAGAHIVNLSISGPRDPLLERLAAELVRRGLVIVAAGEDREAFPGSITDSVLAVEHAPPSVAGPSLTLLPDNRYGMRNGTSISAARITGVAALLRQLVPGLSAGELQALLASPTTATIDIAGLLAPSQPVAAQRQAQE